MTRIKAGWGGELDWALPTIREAQLRTFLDAEDEKRWQVWQKASVGPQDIRVYGSADLRFGTEFYRKGA